MGNEAPYMGWRNPAHAFRVNQAKQLRDLKASAQVYEQAGSVDFVLPAISDIGEGSYAIKFTFKFIEPPTFLSGAELIAGSVPVHNKFPQITGSVGNFSHEASGYATIYTGAVLYVAISASKGQSFRIHYTFTGKAMSNTTGD